MSTITLQQLKEVLLPIREKVRSDSSHRGLTAVATAYYNAKAEILDTLLIWIGKNQKEEVIDMAELKTKLSAQTVTLADIPQKTRKAPVEEELLKYAEELTQALEEAKRKKLPREKWPVKRIDGIRYSHFSTKIRDMIANGKLDKSFQPLKRGDECYLIKN